MDAKENLKKYEFLIFHQQTVARINRMDLENDFIKNLIKEELVRYDQSAPVMHLKITEKGRNFLKNMEKEAEISHKAYHTYIRGASKEMDSTKKVKKVDDALLYRFLKFHIGVIRRTKQPYLRELVAEDYLMDSEELGYGQAAKLISKLVDDGILKYDQFGAFPGTGVTEKGKEFFQELKKKIDPDED